MRLSASDLSHLVEELSTLLVGGFIQKIHQPLPTTVTFDIRQPGETFTLFASVQPQTTRLHVFSQSLENPATPPSFCQYLRATIQGSKLEAIEQTPGDRIIWLSVTKPSFSGYLVIALTGRHSNLYLLDSQKHLLRSLRPDHQIVGQIYQVPTPPPKRESEQTKYAELEKGSWVDQARNKYKTSRYPLSLEIEEAFRHLEEQQEAKRQEQLIRSNVKKAIKKTQHRIRTLTQDLEHASRYEEYQRYGELLKSHLTQISKGQAQITVTDYYDEALPELTLPLDPEKDGPGNLEDYFKKYRKFTGAQKNLVPRLDEAKTELLKLQKEQQEIESGEMTKSIERPSEKSPAKLREKKPRQITPKSQKATPYRRYISQDGQGILVGKSAKDNDTLTFKVSKQDDMWLHARGTPGSHVIIEMEKKPQVPPETLKDAATLALFYSDLRKSGKGEVIYTLRKNVRKPKGAKPGSVTVTQEKTTWIYVDQSRLDRLKNSNTAQNS